MEIIETDVAIVGAGGAGLRTAIALAEADPNLRIALIWQVVLPGRGFCGTRRTGCR